MNGEQHPVWIVPRSWRSKISVWVSLSLFLFFPWFVLCRSGPGRDVNPSVRPVGRSIRRLNEPCALHSIACLGSYLRIHTYVHLYLFSRKTWMRRLVGRSVGWFPFLSLGREKISRRFFFFFGATERTIIMEGINEAKSLVSSLPTFLHTHTHTNELYMNAQKRWIFRARNSDTSFPSLLSIGMRTKSTTETKFRCFELLKLMWLFWMASGQQRQT